MSDVTRNRVNWACGWVLGIGVFGAAVALDPLALYNPAMEGAFDSFYLTVTAVMAFVSLGGYTFFSKPYVAVRDGELVVQNPLSLDPPMLMVGWVGRDTRMPLRTGRIGLI